MEPLFPPFEPEQTPQQKRFRAIPLRVLIPNMVTLLALAAGLTGVRFAIEGRLEHAALAILVAAILDGLDGRIARYLKGTSRFGAELDSLADFVSFGCAPALILYFWQLHHLKTAGWLACLLLAFAQALRLARFNVMIDGPAGPDWRKKFSVGVPAPAGAMLAIFPINLSLAGLPHYPGESVVILIWTLVSAALAISRVPTFSGKGGKTPVSREWAIPILVLVVLILALLVSHPFETVSVLTLIYAIGIPLAIRKFIAYKRADAQSDAMPAPPDNPAT